MSLVESIARVNAEINSIPLSSAFPPNILDRPAGLLIDGEFIPVRRLPLLGRKLAWTLRKHPNISCGALDDKYSFTEEFDCMRYVPAHQIQHCELVASGLALIGHGCLIPR